VSDIDTAVLDGLKVLDPNGRLEKLPRGSMIGAAVVDPKRHFATANYCIAKGLLDHLVGEREQRRRHCQAEYFGSLDVACHPSGT